MKLQTARWSRSSDPVLYINSCFGGLFRSRWKTVADWQMMGLLQSLQPLSRPTLASKRLKMTFEHENRFGTNESRVYIEDDEEKDQRCCCCTGRYLNLVHRLKVVELRARHVLDTNQKQGFCTLSLNVVRATSKIWA